MSTIKRGTTALGRLVGNAPFNLHYLGTFEVPGLLNTSILEQELQLNVLPINFNPLITVQVWQIIRNKNFKGPLA